MKSQALIGCVSQRTLATRLVPLTKIRNSFSSENNKHQSPLVLRKRDEGHEKSREKWS